MSEHVLARYDQEVTMRNSKFTETQIVAILREADAGMAVKEVCRKHGISSPTYYKWKAKYGGLGVSELKRMKELEAENAKLKRMYADKAMEADALKDLIEKNSRPGREARGDQVLGRGTPVGDTAGL
jgi:putative transposase